MSHSYYVQVCKNCRNEPRRSDSDYCSNGCESVANQNYSSSHYWEQSGSRQSNPSQFPSSRPTVVVVNSTPTVNYAPVIAFRQPVVHTTCVGYAPSWCGSTYIAGICQTRSQCIRCGDNYAISGMYAPYCGFRCRNC